MENIKNSVFSNLIWRFAERCGAQLVAFIVSIILARLLDPEAYGTIALITVFTTIFQVFVDSGFGNALIQKKDADDLDFSTVFYTNICFCIILYIIVFLISPYIARFYNNTSLVLLIRVLSLTIVISGVKNVQQAYVSKKMIFKKFFFATIFGTIMAAVVGIIMALNGFGVWALIAQQLTNLTIDTFVLWITVKWRPKLIFSFHRLKILFSYAWKLLVSSLIENVYANIRQLLIGKIYSSNELAYFNRGKQFPNFIMNNINNSIDSVLLPTMSKVQDDKKRIKQMTRKSIMISTYIMAPLMVGLAGASKNIVLIVLTEKWLECVPYLCVFCISFMFYPVHTANLNAIKAMGRSDIFLKLEIIKKIIGIILLIVTIRISVFAMALSLLLECIVSQIINSFPNKRLLNYSYIEQLKDIMPNIVLAIIMGEIIYLINFINCNIVLKLIIQIFVGMIIYILESVIFKLETFDYLRQIIKNFLKRKNN